jgi:plasmid segregation protein ParM
MIVGIDAGNHEVKVVTGTNKFKFLSDIGEWRDRRLKQKHGEDDMDFVYGDRKGFAGTLARYECELGGCIMGDTKAHEDTLIRVLLALWKLENKSYQIVVGQPIAQHSPSEKQFIKDMIKGHHQITVNGVTRSFNIERVEVAAEGATAFWSAPRKGLLRIIDVGSATVNCASLIDGRYIDKDSFTMSFGMNTIQSNDLRALARAIGAETLKKYKRNDNVLVIGGAGMVLQPFLKSIYPNTFTLSEPVYANALGFYEIGRRLYDKAPVSRV